MLLLSLLLCVAALVSAKVISSTVEVDNVIYYVPAAAVTTFEAPSGFTYGNGFLTPITVLQTTGDVTTLDEIIFQFLAADDVFSISFMEVVLLIPTGQGASVSFDYSSEASKYNISTVLTQSTYESVPQECTNTTVQAIAPGPYFFTVVSGTVNVYSAYRLYSDTQRAFTYGTIMAADGRLSITSAAIQGGYECQTIAVPSRLYYTPSEQKPLAGYRVGVKDIYDIAGLKTGCGNRAYFNFNPAKNISSIAVQRLIDAGAIIVGKTLTSQFANGETATDDWVDQFSPFNPRGEGYSDPSSSSSGSGAAMGAYEWLDFAIGSDTGGSIRGPAGAQGLYGIRPSHGALPLTGVMPLCSELDTAGFFARTPEMFKTFAKTWYQTEFDEYTQYPTQILNAIGAVANSDAAALIDSFVQKLSTFMNATTTNYTLAAAWNASGLTPPLPVALNTTYPTLIGYEQYTVLGQPFNESYRSATGKSPFFDPVVLTRWMYGQSRGAAGFSEALGEKAKFMSWFNTSVLTNTQETCSNALFIYAQTTGEPNLRNQYIPLSGPPTGFSSSRVAVMAENPDIVVPIGQVPYYSTISQTTEYLPVTISLLAAKGIHTSACY